MKQVYLLILFLLGFGVSGQTRHDTLRLFYAINSTEPIKADALKNLMVAGVPQQIQITGYADFLHSTSYNQVLSEKRAIQVRNLLLKLYPEILNKISTCNGKGEQFSKGDSAAGEQFWRRVDVIVTREVKTKISQTQPVSEIKKTPDKVVEQPKALKDLKKGESVALEGLSFIPGRHIVLPASEPKLEELLETLKEHQQVKIQIQGHVCCTPNGRDGLDLDTRKYELSVNRAQAIYQYLIKNGIDRKRLSFRGFGGSKPKVVEDSPENEQINRRVEIMIIDSGEKKNEAEE